MWPNPRIPFQMSNERARLEPLDGKPLMVNPVVNIEYWPFDRPMPRGILPPPHVGPDRTPRCPQLLLGRVWAAVRRTTSVRSHGAERHQGDRLHQCAMRRCLSITCQSHRRCRLGTRRSWLVSARSLKQIEDEEGEVRKCLVRLEQLSGKKVRGWFGAGGGETMQTPDVLKRCGVDFMHDWLLDDLPCWMVTAHGPLLCLPYTWEPQ